MKKALVWGLLLSVPAFCQFGLGDAVMIAKLEAQLVQLRNILQNAQQYKQLFDNASAFAKHPALFLGAVSQIEQVALNTAASSGLSTPQRIDHMRQVIRMQQIAMQEAQGISTISHGNVASIGNLASAMDTASQELSELNAEFQYEQRVKYYQDHQTYQPQAQIVSGWRLK